MGWRLFGFKRSWATHRLVVIFKIMNMKKILFFIVLVAFAVLIEIIKRKVIPERNIWVDITVSIITVGILVMIFKQFKKYL
jgi:hypothetical protein